MDMVGVGCEADYHIKYAYSLYRWPDHFEIVLPCH